jgi:hypothetical protein
MTLQIRRSHLAANPAPQVVPWGCKLALPGRPHPHHRRLPREIQGRVIEGMVGADVADAGVTAARRHHRADSLLFRAGPVAGAANVGGVVGSSPTWVGSSGRLWVVGSRPRDAAMPHNTHTFADFEPLAFCEMWKLLHRPERQSDIPGISWGKSGHAHPRVKLEFEPEVQFSSLKPKQAAIAGQQGPRSAALIGRQQVDSRVDYSATHGTTE